jgi:XRE family aerobic/anaerobic benzoate catabolism transcriptional regulator
MSRRAPTPPAAARPALSTRDGGGALGDVVSRQVRALRESSSLTRAQLSERSGVSVAYLARLEAGAANISLGVLEQLARALGVPAQWLLAEPVEAGSDLELIVAWLRGQTPAVQAEVWSALRARGGPGGAHRPASARIALIGLRGAGKSTLGARLARRLGVPFVELNREIERAGGVAVPEVFTLYGASGYRTLERSCLKQVIERHAAVVLATGGGLVTEAGTYALLRGAFRTVWLRASPEDHFDRVRRQQDARIAAPALERVAMANIRTMLAAREPLYSKADLTLDTGGRSVARSLAELVGLLGPTVRSGTPRSPATGAAPDP